MTDIASFSIGFLPDGKIDARCEHPGCDYAPGPFLGGDLNTRLLMILMRRHETKHDEEHQ